MSKRIDPILLVCGVPSERLLQRIEAARGGGTAADCAAAQSADRVWRFTDFAALSDAEFVEHAHQGLLGRPPRPAETARRLRDIGWGMTRAEIVLRLIGCAEGRRHRATTAGVILPALVAAAGTLDRLLPSPGQPAATTERRAAASIAVPVMTKLKRAYTLARTVPLLGGLAERAVDLSRLRSLRREVLELRAEVARLRAEGSGTGTDS